MRKYYIGEEVFSMREKKSRCFIVFLMACVLVSSSVFALPTLAAEASDVTVSDIARTVPGYYGVTADVLNIRSGPGTNYSIVGQLYYGDAILVTSISNGWAKFLYKGVYRYVSDDYLKEYKG